MKTGEYSIATLFVNSTLTNEVLFGFFHDPKSREVFRHDENNLKASAVLSSSIISAAAQFQKIRGESAPN